MATLNVSFPAQMRQWVEAQVQTGKYASASDYLRDLIRRDQRVKEHLDDLLIDGLNSGRATPLDMKEIRKKARERLKRCP